jgi:hypothetical protein
MSSPFNHHLSKRMVAFIKLVLCLSVLGLASCSPIRSKNENFLTSYRGFQQEKKTDDRIVFEGDLARMATYKGVYIEEVKVVGSAKGKRKKPNVEELTRIQRSFYRALQTEISQSRVPLTNGPGPEILSLRAGVLDVTPGKPAVFAMGYAPYVGLAATATKATTGLNMGAGSAIIEVEFIDSVTRQQYFAMVDKIVGSKLQVTNGMSRWGHVDAAIKEWAKKLREKLSASIDARMATTPAY